MSRIKRKKGWLAVLCAASLLLGSFTGAPHSAAKQAAAPAPELLTEDVTPKENGYESYLIKHANEARPEERITVRAASFAGAEGMTPELRQGSGGETNGALLTGETGTVSWTFDVPAAGLYNVAVRYYNEPGKNTDIEREILINGQLPFQEASSIYLQRIWVNESDESMRDERGNDLRPSQREESMWQDSVLRDMTGYFVEPYSFYFEEGSNTISFVSLREPVVLEAITLFQVESPIDYEDQLTIYREQGYEPAGQEIGIKIQGEDAARKSSPTLYPVMDRDPRVEPYHVSKARMNTIGGFNWRLPGQWIEWEVEVPEDGLYEIAFKAKQTFARGASSARALTIDGKSPFREAERLLFPYSSDWRMHVLGAGDNGGAEPYLFHLKEGKHTIRLEVTLGELAPVLRATESSVLALNELYREIISFTGSVPDPFRDYQLEKRMPDLKATLANQAKAVASIATAMEGGTGKTTDRTATLRTLAYQLQDMAEHPDSVPTRLEPFKTNVGAVGAWMLNVKEQPLAIDYLMVTAPGAKLPKAESSWWQKTRHEARAFAASFFEDYDSLGNNETSEQAVTVWITSGRDQAQILKRMIDNDFTSQSGVPINLRLVSGDVLLAATLAGKGPDVAIQVGNDVPVNFAMRSALYDLSEFPDFDQVTERFQPSAVVPYEYNGGVFALPEQHIFPVMFYRKDILRELGLEVPQTWDDVYAMIPHLQKNNLQIGLPQQTVETAGTGVTDQLPPNPTFAMMLYQNEGELYRDGGLASAIDAEPSIQAFRKWTELYANYKLPIVFDFPNRFRTGEMPIGIAEYSTYNHLSVSAPEIRGLWDFSPVPGIATGDGTIRRDVSGRGFGAVMFRNAANKDGAWSFLKWWTDKEAQVEFGREMEGLLGPAGRYPTANLAAMEELPWPASDLSNLKEQWKWVRGNPEVPGGYFTGRHLDNAFRRVVIQGEDARETIDLYVRAINEEIEIKRKEFRLPLGE